MATNPIYVTSICQYIRGNSDCVFETVVAVIRGAIGYSENKAVAWLNAFIEGPSTYFVIEANTFDALKQKALSVTDEEVPLLSTKIAGVMDLFLAEFPRYYRDNGIAYNIFDGEEVDLVVLQSQIDNLQSVIDGLHKPKTSADQETLDFWNDNVLNVEEEEQNLIQEKDEKQSLLTYLLGL